MNNDSSQFSRTELLLGKDSTTKLAGARVAIFGIGGVGGYCLEALARAGVGSFALIDHDTVNLSNINRQIIATHSSLNRLKVDVAEERILDINPCARIEKFPIFYSPKNAPTDSASGQPQNEINEFPFPISTEQNEISKSHFSPSSEHLRGTKQINAQAIEPDLAEYDYIVDAIDTVAGKIALIENAARLGIPIISCMGAGNKLDPLAFRIADISKTSACPLARVMRRELKKRGISQLKVVFSTEQPVETAHFSTHDSPAANAAPIQSAPESEEEIGEVTRTGKRNPPGSCSFVPSVAGLILASEVIKDLLKTL